jgi:large repetitive protein
MRLRTLLFLSIVAAITPVLLTAQLTISPASLADGTQAAFYSQQLTATGGHGPYTWSIVQGSLPPGIVLSTSGLLSGTPAIAGFYGFTVRAFDIGSPAAQLTGTLNYSLRINYPPLAIATSTLASGVIGYPYSQSLAATGGAGNYSWSLVSGTLPLGLTLSPSGLISGLTATQGTFSIVVQVSSFLSSFEQTVTALRSFSLTITYPAVVITTPSTLPSGTVNVPYLQTLRANGGTLSYTWAQLGGTLPPGLLLTSDGNISGTPTLAGNYSFTIQVSSQPLGASILSATQTFTLVITAPPLAITTIDLAGGKVGVSYAQSLGATGGTPPYDWRISQGSLPDGLTLSTSGTIAGTPTTANTFRFAVTVTDSRQVTDTRSYVLTVSPSTLLITTDTLPSGTVGIAYSSALAASGGVTPYAWSLTSGSLPDGLTLSASGTINGTPTAAGTFTPTIQATDAAQQRVSKSFSIVIVPNVKITTTTIAGGVVGSAYSQQLAATGGTAPYTWNIDSGLLPSGLSLGTATGVLAGTPLSAGSSTFVVRVTDQNGSQDKASITVVIIAALNITTDGPLASAVTGTLYEQPLAASGGTPPYQWTLLDSTLPAGLTLDVSTGQIAGTPSAAGLVNFSIQVTDSARRTATKNYTIDVTAALTITTVAPLARGVLGNAYRQALTAAGGSQSIRWSISAGALPGGISIDAASGLLAGTPTAAGSFDFTVSASDSRQTATKAFTITIGLPAAPAIAIAGLPPAPAPATQPAFSVAIPAAYPTEITGQVTLEFTPDSGPDDPAVQFIAGGRSLDFRIPSGSTQATFTAGPASVQTGTVAGVLTFTLRMRAANVDITPTPAPTQTIRIAKAAPVITSASLVRTSGGFDVVVIGYATSREITSATVTYSASAGVTLSNASATIALSPLFTTWYQDPNSARFGSQFSLRLPFTVQGNANPVSSISVVLTNSLGTSAAASASF